MIYSELLSRIGILLAANIALVFAYGAIPSVDSPFRTILAVIQFGFIVLTMAVTIRYVLEEY